MMQTRATCDRLTRAEENRVLKGFPEGGWLLILDFDGTLAPLHEDPSRVRMKADLKRGLLKLQRRIPVWVITGRSLRDIRPLLPAGIPIIAEHGMDCSEKGYTGYESAQSRSCLRVWEKLLQALIQDHPGAWLERKEMSLSLHYRRVRHPVALRKTLRTLLKTLPASERPRLLAGKALVNLLPARSPNKGDAVQWILSHFPPGTRVIYVGDEPTDENAFRVLRSFRHLTLHIGGEKKTAARYRLPSQRSFEAFLRRLSLRIDPQPPKSVMKSSQ